MFNSKLLLSIFSLLLLIAQPSWAAPVKILPLGDSISTADRDRSYRAHLWHMLTNAGFDIDYVGSLHFNPLFESPLDDNVDPDHEAHGGVTTDQLLTGVDPTGDNWLNGIDVDVTLIHAGTNDILPGSYNPAVDNPDIMANLEAIIDELQSKNPDMDILVAKLIPIGDEGVSDLNDVTPLNALITDAWATSQSTPNSIVTIVDQNSDMDLTSDYLESNPDQIHLNASGDYKMALRWFNALTILPKMVDNQTSNTIATPPVTTDLTLLLNASDVNADGILDTASEAGVTTWNDKSSLASPNNVSLISGTAPTQTLTNSQNGKPVLDFNSGGMTTASTGQITADSGYTKFVVFSYDGDASNNLISSENSTALWANNLGIGADVGMFHVIPDNIRFLTTASTYNDSKYHIAAARYGDISAAATDPLTVTNTISNTIKIDTLGLVPEVVSNTTLAAHNASKTEIGSYSSSSILNGKIAEAIVFDRALTDTEILAVENYLYARWFTLPVPTALDQTISFTAPADITFGDAAPALSATGGASGNPVTFATTSPTTVCTVTTAGVIIIAGAGNCSITASQAGNDNYNAAADVTDSFNIAIADQTISFTAPADITFGDTAPALSATGGASGNLVTFATTSPPTVCTVTTAGVITIAGAGNCSITASQAGNDDYSAAADVTDSFNIVKADQTITFTAPADITFGDTAPTLIASVSSSLNVSFVTTSPATVCTVTTAGVITIAGAGNCVITASQAGDDNYNAATDETNDFDIAKAGQTIAFIPPTSKTFGDAPFAVTATATSGLPVNITSTTLGVCSVSANTVTILSGGTCILAANQAGNTNYKPAPQVTANITSSAANQVITFTPPATKTFGDAPFTISATTTSGLVVTDFSSTTPAVCTISGNTVTLVNNGTCKLTADQTGDDNYNPAPQVLADVSVAASASQIGMAAAVEAITSDTAITAEQLNTIDGASGAISGIDYTAALQAGTYADPANPTPAEIQVVIDAENAIIAAALNAVIEDIAGNADGIPITPEQINLLANVSGALSGGDYTLALAAGTYANPADPTAAEIQTVIDAENANIAAAFSAVLEDIAGNTDGTPVTAEQINLIAGVADAVTGRDYTLALAAGTYADSANPTATEIQAVIDAENAKFTGGGGAASLNWLVLLGLIALLRRRRISI